MDLLHGFTNLRTDELPEYRAKATLYRHVKTGANLVSISVDDENKVFGITFRTPPSDHTGVAHILEHSVLCGSRKYPTKEPFVELLKGSLQTFLNAFTYPDKTCYPVASQHPRDFYNLIDVYLDAVFYPLLTRETFEQEGWHYELDAPDQPLRFKGVVFNEMKGVYSSPDSVLIEQAQRSLFPDTVYGLDSGGDPAHIPDLTYEQLVDFHRRFYHPSNSLIWFYGDDDPEDRLKFMDNWLSAFEAQPVEAIVPEQPAFAEPVSLTRPYRTDDPSAKSFVALNWALPSPTDSRAVLEATVLSHILIGTPASPLRKALIESGLGDDLCGCGLETHARQMYFSTGLRGVDPSRCGEVAPLARSTLESLAAQGIDPKTVEASLNTVEFALRENNTGYYPRGLSLMLRALTSWTYGGDPIAPLRFAEGLADLRRLAQRGERPFEALIRKWLLENPHHSVLTLHADPGLGERLDAEERARLDAARARFTDEELAALVRHTQELRANQARPDDPAALAKIPRLSVQDLPRENRRIPTEKQLIAKTRVLVHNLFTNGITYVDVGFNLRALSLNQLPYVPVLGRALLETGTKSQDFVALQQRIGSKTGGITPKTFSSIVRDTNTGTVWLFLRGRALDVQTRELFDILGEVLHGARLDLQARIRQLALEEKARVEADLIPSGHRYVGQRARAGFNEAEYAAEAMGGIRYLFFLRELIAEIDSDWPAVSEKLATILNTLLNRRAMVLNITRSADAQHDLAPELDRFLLDIPERTSPNPEWIVPSAQNVEGLIAPATVHYVAKVYDLRSAGHEFRGSDLVVARFLRSGYLWERIRMQGGAYGAFCSYDYRSGLVTFSSYRDPNLQATIDAFDSASEYLETIDLDRAELEKAIIGAIGDLDQHLLPDAKGYAALCRWLTNDQDDFRQKMREEILSTTLEDFHRFGAALRGMRGGGRVAVLGGAESVGAFAQDAVTRVL